MKNENIRFDDNGNIVAKNPLPNELPDVSVTFKSGKTLFRFVARYDGDKSLTARITNQMKKDFENDDERGDISENV